MRVSGNKQRIVWQLGFVCSSNANPARFLVDHSALIAVHHERMIEGDGRRHGVVEGDHRQHAVPVHHRQSIPIIHIDSQLLLQAGVPIPRIPISSLQIKKPNVLHKEAKHAGKGIKQRRIRFSIHHHAVLRHTHEIRDAQRAERHRDREQVLATRIFHRQPRVCELDVPIYQQTP